jgi:hypothetical protein
MQVIIIKKVRKDYTNITGVELVKKKSIKFYWYILKYKLIGYKIEILDEEK